MVKVRILLLQKRAQRALGGAERGLERGATTYHVINHTREDLVGVPRRWGQPSPGIQRFGIRDGRDGVGRHALKRGQSNGREARIGGSSGLLGRVGQERGSLKGTRRV